MISVLQLQSEQTQVCCLFQLVLVCPSLTRQTARLPSGWETRGVRDAAQRYRPFSTPIAGEGRSAGRAGAQPSS